MLQFGSMAMMTALGVWACQWRELRPITFGGSATQSTADVPVAGEAAGDEEMGYGRGRGRGRGREGAGEYEMVGMKGQNGEAS